MNAPIIEGAAVQVSTVKGLIPAVQLGMTLTHEHLICDWSGSVPEPEDVADLELFRAEVDASMNWLLTENPRCCADNVRHDQPAAILCELVNFTQAGGRTVIDCTTGEVGRDPLGLRELSDKSGLQIVMGSGWYVHAFHSSDRVLASADELRDELLAEFEYGVANSGVKPGIIGEIGISPQFTDAEKTRLRAASRAQKRLGVPLFVHLPGWQRRALEVLQIVLDEEGVAPQAVVLCHMDPSGEDVAYQCKVADRGVWLEFDMIGMSVFYAGEGQSPAPDQTAAAIAGLIRNGHASQVLLSHDLAVKSMWARNGGNGLGYVPRLFLPRLERHGVPAEVTAMLMTANPCQLFTDARNAILDT